MKIAFATEDDKGIDGVLAGHFGRCPYYTFVEVEGDQIKNVETKENPYFNAHAPGVVPEFIAKQGAKVIVAGGMGPRAIDWFERLGVEPITGVYGKVRDLLNDYLNGKLSGAEPCDEHR
ncbi:MAG: NifB/NifX family molybdenum-iron cluster-binding protein [Candidatus Bathycorpusculaceae bacterium]